MVLSPTPSFPPKSMNHQVDPKNLEQATRFRYEDMSAIAPSRGLRQATWDHVTSVQPDPQSVQHSSGPPHPASAFAESRIIRPLSNIVEGSQSTSEHEEGESVLETPTKGRSRSLLHCKPSLDSITYHESPTMPERRSSRYPSRNQPSKHFRDLPNLPPLPSPGPGQAIPVRGRSTSPIRDAIERLDPVSSDMQRVHLRTFVRSVRPTDILDFPELGHSRVSLEMHIPAPLFVGGGSVEGEIGIVIDDGKTRNRQRSNPALSIGRISIDVLGVETSHGKNFIFRTLATELLDETHPPPATMAAASRAVSDAFWEVKPSVSILPIRLDLPVHMGPPPYSSRIASIKYILCATVAIRIAGKQQYVRKSQEIPIITVHDPEKALVNLPNPLTAYDELFFSIGAYNVIKLTVGVHRQAWVSGNAIFVDVHVSNRSTKKVKRIDLLLEKVTTLYHHAAASTRFEAASHLRLPDKTIKEIAARSTIKKARHGWQGIDPQSQETWTWRLEVPPGLVTIDAGRYFGIRFFVSVVAHAGSSKTLVVQIPITIIHPNSLDIPPNSIAQVATAIETRRIKSRSNRHSESIANNNAVSEAERPVATTHYHPSRAFTAARRQSLEQLRSSVANGGELDDLAKVLNESPRKYNAWHPGRKDHNTEQNPSPTAIRESGKAPWTRQQAMSDTKAKTIRLMRSTSGLGFTSSSSLSESAQPSADLDCFATSYQRRRGLEVNARKKVGNELELARKRSWMLGPLGTWRNVAAEQVSRQDWRVPLP